MSRWHAFFCILASGCEAGEAEPAGRLPPPGPGGVTLHAPEMIVSGEEVTITVTASDLASGDHVQFGWGTAMGGGLCPNRAQTGGATCMAITGDVQLLGEADAVESQPGVFEARLTTSLTALEPVRYVQAFVNRGADSSTSNVQSLRVSQPYPILRDEIAVLEGRVGAVEGLTTRVEDLESLLEEPEWVDMFTPNGWQNFDVKCRRSGEWIEFRGFYSFPVIEHGWPATEQLLLPEACRPASQRNTEQPCHSGDVPRNIVCNNDFFPDGTVEVYSDYALLQLRFEGFRIWGG